MSESPALELDSFFLRELQTVNEDVRRLAALATFNRLRPSNNVTVEQFLAGLQAHKELWAIVGSLGIVEFAQGLAGHQAASRATEPHEFPAGAVHESSGAGMDPLRAPALQPRA